MSERAVSGILGLFTRSWWVVFLRGLVAIVFGILAFAWPGVTLATLVLLFGGYVLLDGIFSLFAAISGWRHREDRWLLLLEGFIGIWAGTVTFRTPAITAVMLVLFIAVWAMATGVLRIVAAIRLRKEISGEVWLAFSGLASVVFAFMIMLRPGAGALALLWVIAGYALVLGASLVMLGIELRSLRTTS